jgi:hypothetical protein
MARNYAKISRPTAAAWNALLAGKIRRVNRIFSAPSGRPAALMTLM